jgi:FkbM family methyltransferase
MALFYDDDRHDQYLRNHFFPDHTYKGVFVDVGAADDKWLSISRHFLDSGWTVLSLEPNKHYAAELRKCRPNVIEVAASDKPIENAPFGIYWTGTTSKWAPWSGLELEGTRLHANTWKDPDLKPTETLSVKVDTLNNIIENWNGDHKETPVSHIDVLAIDVEGNEFNVLKGLDLNKYAPRVILVEEMEGQSGTIDPTMETYLKTQGYRKAGRNVFNNVYVPLAEPVPAVDLNPVFGSPNTACPTT